MLGSLHLGAVLYSSAVVGYVDVQEQVFNRPPCLTCLSLFTGEAYPSLRVV